MKLHIEHTIEQQSLIKNQQHASKPLVFSIDLSIDEEHNIVGLFGPSGAGKSTILKILAGLIPNAHYVMHWRNNEYSNKKGHQNPCVYVGEDTHLFHHLSLLDNLKLVQKQSKTHANSPFSIEDVISLCHLSELIIKMPWQLSTGEKQRSCFARALLTGKKILLLDEAFSALDWTKRMAFNHLLREVVQQHGYFVIMVSHSLRELSLSASNVITVDSGQITEQAKLTDALASKLANSETEHEHYFSALRATFSHLDEQDPALQIWTLVSPQEKELDNKGKCAFYVKEKLAQPLSNFTKIHELMTAHAATIQTFIVDANKVSISTGANHQTSMVNCLAVNVEKITHIDSGVLVSGKWQSQILRSIITTKSLMQLNIKVDDTVYFVFKAL